MQKIAILITSINAISREKTTLTRNFLHKNHNFYLQLYAINAIFDNRKWQFYAIFTPSQYIAVFAINHMQ